MDQEYDLIIRNAKIIDGSGKPAYDGSVDIIADGKINSIRNPE
jgi:N-acyl-D-aspartate/D-glutamate deacylase